MLSNGPADDWDNIERFELSYSVLLTAMNGTRLGLDS